MTSINDLLATVEAAGVTLFVDEQGRLRHRGRRGNLTRRLKREIAAHQGAITATLRAIGTPAAANPPPTVASEVVSEVDTGREGIRTVILKRLHPLAHSDTWDDSAGYCPRTPHIRNGVTHKRADCPAICSTTIGSWQHLLAIGREYRSTCWPGTDLKYLPPNSRRTRSRNLFRRRITNDDSIAATWQAR